MVTLARAVYENAPDAYAPTHDPYAKSLLPQPLRLIASAAGSLWGTQPALTRQLLRAITFGMSEHVALRTVCIDEIVQDALKSGVEQLVTLGAGFDARAWRLTALQYATVYEVDHPATQSQKQHWAARATHVPAERQPVFVPVDFTKDSLSAQLGLNGHSARQSTTWILEGVSMYLKRDALRATLSEIRARSAEGSIFAFTYVTPAVVSQWSQSRKGITLVTQLIGERFEGLMETADVHALLNEFGWTIERDEDTRQLARRLAPAVDASTVWVREHVVRARLTPRS